LTSIFYLFVARELLCLYILFDFLYRLRKNQLKPKLHGKGWETKLKSGYGESINLKYV